MLKRQAKSKFKPKTLLIPQAVADAIVQSVRDWSEVQTEDAKRDEERK